MDDGKLLTNNKYAVHAPEPELFYFGNRYIELAGMISSVRLDFFNDNDLQL